MVNHPKRLEFLFSGGIESAGGVFEILCVIAVIIAVFALYAFYQLIVFFAVIIVLTVFSGGAALRIVKGTFILMDEEQANSDKIEVFVKTQISAGHFVKVDKTTDTLDLGDVTRSSNKATLLFKAGIQFALIIATFFIIIEVAYWLYTGHWLSGLNPDTVFTETLGLTFFGLTFLAGVILMNVGVRMHHNLQKRIKPE